MVVTINVFEKPSSVINLRKGTYTIYLSGGHSVSFGIGFQVIIRNSITLEKMPLKPTKKFRGKLNGAKTIKFFTMEIRDSNNYLVEILNPDELVIKKSILGFKNLFLGLPDKSEINLIIERSFR